MKSTLLYQHQSSQNHGCEALVYTISEQIKKVCPEVFLSVASFFKEDDEKFDFPKVDIFIKNKNWLRRYSLPWLIHQFDKRLLNNQKIQEMFMYCRPCFKAAQSADICVAIGGDTYCYNKGKEHWPLERKIRRQNKKMMLWGASIEPKDIQGELADHLSVFDIITVRDPISYLALKDNNVKSKIIRCSDPAFLLPLQSVDIPQEWRSRQIIGLNFSPMMMGNIIDKAAIRNSLLNLVEYILRKDFNVLLIPHVRLHFNDDINELFPIYDYFKNTERIFLIDDKTLNARQLKSIISQCELFIGARTHATIAAYSTFVPTLSIGYSVKSRGIAQDLFENPEEMTIPVQDLHTDKIIIEAFDFLLKQKYIIRKHLEKVIPEYSLKAQASGIAFGNLLNN